MLKLAFYKAKYGTWKDKSVGASTFSPYSHVELVFPSGMCASSSPRDGGIRFKYIDLDDHWDVYDLVNDYDEAAIEYWFRINAQDSYDWPGAIGSVFGLDLSSEDKKYCSYACAFVLGIDPVITPGGLFRYLKKAQLIRG